MDNASFLVNTLIHSLSPWYPLEFRFIVDAFVEVKIGSYVVRAYRAEDEGFQLKLELHRLEFSTLQATNFINHLNGILAGKVRNDAGELVSA